MRLPVAGLAAIGGNEHNERGYDEQFHNHGVTRAASIGRKAARYTHAR